MSPQQQKIAEWLKAVRFRKKTFGGVSEADVWKKINELNGLYETALAAERARYDALLERQKREMTAYVRKKLREGEFSHGTKG